jgi:multiple sugar transport system substrate-binding protein
MRSQRRRILKLLDYLRGAAAAAVVVLAGCGGGESSVIVVDFWAMGAEGEHIKPLVDKFERTHPGARIRIQQVPWTAAHEKLLTAFAGESLPDVCQLGNTWLAEFHALDALEDLTGRVAQSEVIKPEDFFGGVWQGNVLGGRVVGVPWYVDTRLLFYRTDLLAAAGHDQPPATWDEWLEAMRDLRDQAATSQDRYAILLPTNEFEQPVILGMQAGADMLKDGGRYGNFSSPEFRRAFQFYVDLFREGFAPRVPNTQISNVWQEFERGTFAMYITGPWNVREFRARLPEAMQDKWSTAPWPSPGGDGPGVSTAGGSSLVLFRQSTQKDAAWQFIEFLSRADQQAAMCQSTSNLPAHREAWVTLGLVDDPKFRAFHEQLKNVRPVPPVPEWQKIVEGELVKTAEAVIAERVTVADGLARLDRRVDQILEKRRWMLAR